MQIDINRLQEYMDQGLITKRSNEKGTTHKFGVGYTVGWFMTLVAVLWEAKL